MESLKNGIIGGMLDFYSPKDIDKQYILEFYKKSVWFSSFTEFFKEIILKGYDTICFLRRDEYFLYKQLKDYTKCLGLDNLDTKVICAYDINSDLKGKKVAIFEITLSQGYAMFESYLQLKKIGASEVKVVIYALSTEWPRDSLISAMSKIQKEIFKDTNIRIWGAYKQFLRDVDLGHYESQEMISNIKLDMIKLLSGNFYDSFISEKFDHKEKLLIEIIRKIFLGYDAVYRFSARKIMDLVLRQNFDVKEDEISKAIKIMLALGILDISSFYLSGGSEELIVRGKNFDWLVCREGRLCFTCAQALYICKEENGYKQHINLILKKAKELCTDISRKNNEPFDEKIFDYYVSWYSSINFYDIEYHIFGQRLFIRDNFITNTQTEILKAICQMVYTLP